MLDVDRPWRTFPLSPGATSDRPLRLSLPLPRLGRDKGPPATGEAATQAAMTALLWICTPLGASGAFRSRGRRG